MKERIIQFLKAENKTSAQLADDIGVQPSGISHIISGRNNPSLDFVIKMLEKYKFISPEWLLFGRGDMYRDQSMRDLFSVESLTDRKYDPLPLTGLPEKDVSRQEPDKQPFDTRTGKDVTHGQKSNDGMAKKIETIVWFYSDQTFSVFSPES
jgi:transcriptional regulator with XRE-family HTH domain